MSTAAVKALVGSAVKFEGRTEDAKADTATELLYRFAHELGDDAEEANELIERLLAHGAMSVLYGDSNSGKTFLAIDLGCSVARAAEWMDRQLDGGLVVYLGVEAPASVRTRVRAYQRYHDCKVPNFAIVQSPINLFNGGADTERIIDLVKQLERRAGAKCHLIIGDTLSRLAAGANENSGEDMSVVVAHIDRIRHDCAAHFLLIHHCGKDAARGMRGWSGMRAATDTEIEVTADADTGMHAAEVTKQRDIPGKGDRLGFRLHVVTMGPGKWGAPRTSCVVLPTDAPAKRETKKRPSEIAGAITELLTSRGSGMLKGEMVKHFDGRYAKSAVYRELKKMAEIGKVNEAVGVVALVKQ